MVEFEDTQWANNRFAKEYLDDSQIYLPYRSQFFETARYIFAWFHKNDQSPTFLDLGCGDGKFIEEILPVIPEAKVTAIDGSNEMITKAQVRLKSFKTIHFQRKNFNELLSENSLNMQYDMIFSSLAIHHLSFEMKARMYKYIYSILKENGTFLHYDVVSAPNNTLEELYLDIWNEWIRHHPNKKAASMMDIPDRYKLNADNIPDILESQIAILKEVGFNDVDCYLKHGIFTLFGGRKSR